MLLVHTVRFVAKMAASVHTCPVRAYGVSTHVGCCGCFQKAFICWWLCGHKCVFNECASSQLSLSHIHTCGASVTRSCMPPCVWAGLGLLSKPFSHPG